MKKLKNYSEAEILKTIDDVVKTISPNYTFGYYDVDDISQEARILAVNAIDNGKYDETRPLRNFLCVFLKNRLLNLRRDKYFRHTPPCYGCPFYDPKLTCTTNMCKEFDDKMECERYNLWSTLNNSKKNLVDPIDIDGVDMERENTMVSNGYYLEEHTKGEMEIYIDRFLPISMRADYLKILSNYGVKYSQQVKLPKDRVKEIQITVSGILENYYANKT
jgi:hypothetical protein